MAFLSLLVPSRKMGLGIWPDLGSQRPPLHREISIRTDAGARPRRKRMEVGPRHTPDDSVQTRFWIPDRNGLHDGVQEERRRPELPPEHWLELHVRPPS